MNAEDRFRKFVDTQAQPPCELWTGGRYVKGYGSFYFDGRQQGAHRVAWMLANGEIPDGLFVLHRCDNPPCVKLEHLFLGTARDNLQDAHDKGRTVRLNSAWADKHRRQRAQTHCTNGHELSGDNLRFDRQGWRHCRTCDRATNRRSLAKPEVYARLLAGQRQRYRLRRLADIVKGVR